MTMKQRTLHMATEIIHDSPFSLSPLNNQSMDLQVRNTIQDMVFFIKDLVVDSDGSYKKVTSLYRQAREWKKCIDSKRKELTEPLRKQTSAINDKSKELTDPLDKVIEIANAKANRYLFMLEEMKRKEDEKLRAAAAIFDAEEELYIPPMEQIVRGEGAITVTKTEKQFKVIDITKVPTKYLVVDEAAVKRDLKLGIGEITGLEIFEEKTTQLRMR
jgi:hypothetical protein